MSLVARSALSSIRPRAVLSARQARFVHIENVVNANMPFDYTKKATYGTKLAVFLLSGFALPFVAAYYQMAKKGAPAA